jgi:hypothetical protein
MVVAKYDLGVFVEPDDFEKSLRGASKFVPNSGLRMNSPLFTSYLPFLPLLGNVMNGKILGKKMPGKCLGAWSEVSEGSALLLIFEGFEGRWVAILLRASRLRRDDGNWWRVAGPDHIGSGES